MSNNLNIEPKLNKFLTLSKKKLLNTFHKKESKKELNIEQLKNRSSTHQIPKTSLNNHKSLKPLMETLLSKPFNNHNSFKTSFHKAPSLKKSLTNQFNMLIKFQEQ